jgi:hypothetical protein
METLGMSRMEAAWYTPAATLVRMQRAYLDNAGEEQRWGRSRLDKIMDAYDGKQG